MKNRKALITGASSGIGRAFARRFAREGYDLIITGRRQDRLISLASRLKLQYKVDVRVIVAELSNESELEKLSQTIRSEEDIFFLVNSAGFGSGMNFSNGDIDSHLNMMRVHLMAAIELVHAVLPQMIERREGTIINVSSLAAFFPAPGSTMYSATKSFLLSFTESLLMEVRQYGIRVQALCPGFTRTDFHEKLQFENSNNLVKWMEPEKVVDISIKSLNSGKVICVPGTLNKILAAMPLILPRRAYFGIMRQLANHQQGEASLLHHQATVH